MVSSLKNMTFVMCLKKSSGIFNLCDQNIISVRAHESGGHTLSVNMYSVDNVLIIGIQLLIYSNLKLVTMAYHLSIELNILYINCSKGCI